MHTRYENFGGQVTAAELSRLVTRLGRLVGVAAGERLEGSSDEYPANPSTDAERIELITALEALKGAACAAQARLAVAFDASQRARQRAEGVPPAKVGSGIAEQIALARHESPRKGSQLLGLAKALVHELPETMQALTAGSISEWRATLVCRETALLQVGDRIAVDAHLGPKLAGLFDRATAAEAARIAYLLDASVITRRCRHATTQRYVSLRPAPDTMTYLTAFLPVTQGVAAYAALTRTADTARATGDQRTKGQVMADTLVERVTGQAQATDVPIEVVLVMPHDTLIAQPSGGVGAAGGLGSVDVPGLRAAAPLAAVRTDPGPTYAPGGVYLGADEGRESTVGRSCATSEQYDSFRDDDQAVQRVGASVELIGYGPIPAPIARDLILGPDDPPSGSADAGEAAVWIRRLYTDPVTGEPTTIDVRRRLFPKRLHRLIVARDRYCRTPWCGAPIRHADHVHDHHRDGPTTLLNAQGLCEQCNHVKQAPGWDAKATTDETGRHLVLTTTPTGHTYASTPPDPLTPSSSPRPKAGEDTPAA